jgi:anion-transporting  ArsA/GET3 family ATPase
VSRQAAPGLEHDLLNQARLIVCVGTGGVGKTTTSAALALRAATLGRRTLVLTIDPAKRLANAMGLADLGNEAKSVDLGSIATATGSLDAMMLDAQRTFDDLIRRTAGPHASRILENRVYRIMVDQFAGTQEYMSLERLYDLYESNRWDLIVLDTPPSKNTLDFFESPRRAASMFDEQVMKWFVPAKSGGGGGLFDRIFNPGAVVLKLLSVIGGEKFIAELAEFFDAMRAVQSSFKMRGDKVHEILRAAGTRYVVVASPDPRRMAEAADFQARLTQMRKQVSMFVLNRSHDLFEPGDLEVLRRRAAATGLDADRLTALDALYTGLAALGDRDRAGIRQLSARVSTIPIRTVPVLGHDIHTLEELLRLGASVFAGDEAVELV